MPIINFFTDPDRIDELALFEPLRRFFGPEGDNPYDGKPTSEVRDAFLKAIHADRAPGFDRVKIARLESQIAREFDRFTADFGELLPRDFKVLLFPMTDQWEFVMKRMGGTWGVTFKTCIVMAAHPGGELDRLKRTLHHEMNHSVRLPFIPDDHHFLDRIVLEGMAEAYVDEKFPGEPPSEYAVKASAEQIAQHLPAIRRFWTDPGFRLKDFQDWLYGSDSRGIPQWLGYSLGYQLVKAHRKAYPAVPWNELIRRDCREFEPLA